MLRKTLFVAVAVAMAALVAAGLTFGLPVKSTTSAAATPAAALSCSFPINITPDNISVGPKKTLGGRDVTASWQPPANLPNCVKVKEYVVVARLNFPATFHDNQIKVAGNKTSATVAVGQTLLNKDPVSAKVTVTAVLEVVATSSGSATKPLDIN